MNGSFIDTPLNQFGESWGTPIPETKWGFACRTGQAVSLISYGYEDAFDGLDYIDLVDNFDIDELNKMTVRDILTHAVDGMYIPSALEEREVKNFLKISQKAA